jgi:hypothetical protein
MTTKTAKLFITSGGDVFVRMEKHFSIVLEPFMAELIFVQRGECAVSKLKE